MNDQPLAVNGFQMEAGGIEPPSEGTRQRPSTCVADLFFFRRGKHQPAGFSLHYLSEVSPDLPKKKIRPACFSRRLFLSQQASPEQTSYLNLIRQPVHKNSLHLDLYPNGLTRKLGTSARLSFPATSVETKSPPGNSVHSSWFTVHSKPNK